MNESLLEIKDLRVSFLDRREQVEVVRGLDLSVHEGEIVSIVGESGSGKSVTMKAVMGLLPRNGRIDSGTVRWHRADGTAIDLRTAPEREMRTVRGGEIATVFQDPMTAMNPLKPVGEHLAEVITRHMGLPHREAFEQGIRYLERVGIPSPARRARQYPHEFSGGMRQRAMIAMALSCVPRLLIADEPTTALDVTVQAQILDILRELKEKENLSVVLITHDLGIVASLSHRVLVMYAGLVMEESPVDALFESPRHPYTRALLQSVPTFEDGGGKRLFSIKGIAPSFRDPIRGCPFAPRCAWAMDTCCSELPGLRDPGDGRRVRCHLDFKEGA
jgi:oligopeptide/dipeptide ABC transporter ATP-binding protein